MKKYLSVIVLVSLLAAVCLTGCKKSGSSNGEVVVYNWGEYIDPETLEMFEKETGADVSMESKKANNAELAAYLEQVLPDYDRDRVHPNDIRKLISWYNILVKSGNTDFEEKEDESAAENAQTE